MEGEIKRVHSWWVCAHICMYDRVFVFVYSGDQVYHAFLNVCVLQVNEECSTLRVTLAAVQHDREAAKEQVTTLQTRVISLENLVKVRTVRLCFCCW